MKKCLFWLVAVVALTACKDDSADGSVAPEFRFERPEVSDVASTSARVSCRAPQGGALLQAATAGFVYGTDDEAGAWRTATDCSVSGDLLSACLMDLTPERTYRVRAFVEAGEGVRIEGPECTFATPAEGGGGGGDEDEAHVLVLDNDDPWPESSYAAATCCFDGYYFSMENVADFGEGIQLKKSAGWIANDRDMGVIRRIEVVYSSSTSSRDLCLHLGDAPRPEVEEPLEASEEESGVYVFDCAAAGSYRYFKLVNSASRVCRLTSITIYCNGQGDGPVDPDPDPDPGPGPGPGPDDEAEPVFATPTCSGVTQSGATVSCTYTYAGSKTVASARFVYKTSSGAEQQTAPLASASPVSAALAGLSPSTLYSFALSLEIDGRSYRSAWTSFRTSSESGSGSEGGGSGSGKTRFAGWPELPVERADNDYYYASHLCPDLTIDGYSARNYTVCFSSEHHCPMWVAAPRHTCYTGSAGRSDAYARDPDIPSTIQYYSKSTGGGCNKGHMLGSSERTCSSAVNRQVFYYTNIAPQYSSGFNTGGGGWNILEDWIDGQVCADTTYLVIGTYFEPYTDGYGKSASPKKIEFGGRTDVSCPTMFYIAVLRTKKGNTGKSVIDCSADELKCAVFVRAHTNDLKGQKVSSREMMSVADLERITGFEYFTNVPHAPKSGCSPSDWGL